MALFALFALMDEPEGRMTGGEADHPAPPDRIVSRAGHLADGRSDTGPTTIHLLDLEAIATELYGREFGKSGC